MAFDERIAHYLDNIIAAKPVNFDRLRQLLNRQGYDDQTLFKIFAVDKTSRSRYRISILDRRLFAQLQADFPVYPVNDRVSAARAGDSHKRPVSRAMIILWPSQQEHPVVVINDADGINTPMALAKRLLIVENQENFVQKQRTLAFLRHQYADFADIELDIAHGAGNAITNRLNKAFFDRYQRIDCLLDLDLGGLEIFANLHKLTDHARLHFMLPPCAEKLLAQSKLKLAEKHLPALRKHHDHYPALRPAIELIVRQQRMLEQEMYLQE
ncbi:hypothetical protein Q9L42_012380 [Methylomarinum sp. Ch1-1]|uniref:Wadjet protein JetD C-terminal domain-containing protein n=1 Tax=Methylomarinum roseum TaxID=3067653 RepID=A0AAU7NQA8_9GAMM|nr:hypothetical protein [Methylomarinum sp. Ch1-1]MDP4520896.1 hypothetical protein [Methylomarinum sp. Ch1-1]